MLKYEQKDPIRKVGYRFAMRCDTSSTANPGILLYGYTDIDEQDNTAAYRIRNVIGNLARKNVQFGQLITEPTLDAPDMFPEREEHLFCKRSRILTDDLDR